MRKSVKIILFPAIIVLAGIIWFASDYYLTYKQPNVTGESVLLIYRSYTYPQLMDSIKATGAVNNWKSFSRAAKRKEFEKTFEPGRYLLKEGMTNQDVIRTISMNWETPVKLTLRGYIRKLDRLAGFFSRRFEADSLQFITAINDSLLMDSLGFTHESYLGMFIPNTYEIYWTASPREILKRFHKEYVRFWTPERLAKAESIGFTKEQVSTLAAIVIEETNNVQEMPKIAGVYMNRLRKRMPLQACPTVIYAHLETEPGIRKLLTRHLKIDSPYNTYTHRGLPPGPITIPPISAIDAVLNYDTTGYLYFCAKPEFNGTHNFATTYAQHKRNSAAYNKAYAARERERKNKEKSGQ